MKLAITRFVIVAAIAVLMVVSASTAWAQCPAPSYTPDFSSNQGCLTSNNNGAAPGYPGAYAPASTLVQPAGTPNLPAAAPSNVLEVLRLTPTVSNAAGSVWYNTPQTVAGTFSTTFTFQLSGSTYIPADGIAFVIQNSSLGALGADGCGMGFATGSCTNPGGIPSSVAVDFKTYNDGYPNPNNNSVSIVSNGAGANCIDQACNLFYNNNLPITLADGNIHTATITYTLTPPITAPNCNANGPVPCLDVIVDGNDLFNGGFPVNLATLLSLTPSNNTAWVGFTAGTGEWNDTQDILSWTFTTSEQLTLTELGLGAGTVADTANTSSPAPSTPISCTDAGGGAAQTGACSETDTFGASVTLTATPSGGSSFGGWGPTPGPCAYAGTNPTCTLTMNSPQNVTASFVAPPVTNAIIPNTCSGTNVTGTVNYCPNNSNPISPSNPCTDPNGVQFSVSIPVVSQPTHGEACLALSVTATEVKGDGLCPAGGTGQSGDFDCRMVNFYGYGTDPTTGSTVTPLCYPFSNGDCTFYTLTLTGGGVPNTELYSGGVYWQVAFNSVVAPPSGSYWYGSTPSMLDDPGEDEISPLPWGTNCSVAMQTDNPTLYPGTYYCQFDNDITTFYQPGGSSFDPVGGKTAQINDVVVAFLPTSVPTGASLPPTVAPTAIVVNCIGTPAGCTSSGSSITFTEGTGGTAAATSIGSGTPPMPPYPTPTVTAVTTTSPIVASEAGNTVLLTTIGSFGSQAVPGNTVMVTACTPAGFNGTFAIVSGSITMLSYTDSTSGLGAGTGCQALVLPNGLTFNASTGLVAGTPADGTAGNYPITFTSSNYNAGPPPTGGSVTLSDTLTVSPAGALTITASSGTMTYGGTVPTISPSGSGFVNGDTIASLTTQPTCSTTATSTSLPGTYPSSCSGAVDANYSTIKYVPGTVTVVGLDISPLTVNFGTLYLDQLGLQGITLKNTGTAPIQITNITLGGGSANGDFGDISFCPPYILVPPSTKQPATLPAGKSCVIGVGILATAKVFSPTASTTNLTITDSTATQTVLLTALVINPQAAFSSTYLSSGKLTFPTTTVGKSNLQSITVTNTGNTPLTFGGTPAAVSSSSGDFTLTSTTCANATLNVGGTCAIGVTFTPKANGTFTGTLKVTDNAANSSQTITLSGTT